MVVVPIETLAQAVPVTPDSDQEEEVLPVGKNDLLVSVVVERVARDVLEGRFCRAAPSGGPEGCVTSGAEAVNDPPPGPNDAADASRTTSSPE